MVDFDLIRRPNLTTVIAERLNRPFSELPSDQGAGIDMAK